MSTFKLVSWTLLLLDVSYASKLRVMDYPSRQLSQQKFLTYEPLSKVTDHAAIDQDQKAMEIELSKETENGFQSAYKIYAEGANSKSFAYIPLMNPLVTDLPKGTIVEGTSIAGNPVGGTLLRDFQQGNREVEVQYSVSDVKTNHVDCRVGGSPNPMLDGCFTGEGELKIMGEIYQYTYEPKDGNLNGRTIMGFSTDAQAKMYECDNCPYVDFKKFRDYYGVSNYADLWIRSAFAGGSTNFDNGNADFSDYDESGRVEAVKKGSAYMSVWMYVIREMEDALDDCKIGCQDCNDDPVHAWDEAVAFYTGSLEDGETGYLPYALANKRCENFATCGTGGDSETGQAYVNLEIFKEFNEGLTNLSNGLCSSARKNKEEIVRLMAIPLIQGTLRYAYITGVMGDTRDKPRAEGAVFAAAVLPIVDDCDPTAAATIYNNMRVRSQTGSAVDFGEVKEAFESTYSCMKILCEEVGGLSDRKGGYISGTEPCGGAGGNRLKKSSDTSSSSLNLGLVVGLTVGLVVLAAFVVLMSCRTWKSGHVVKENDLEGVEVNGHTSETPQVQVT